MADTPNAIAQLGQFWATRNSRQKAFLAGGAIASGLLVAVFVWLIGTPDYKPLSSGLDDSDAQALVAKLDQQGIAHQTSADGKTISVPADKLAAARMQMASDQDLHSGRIGFELFDKSSWGQTEFDEKVTYQRALEGELGRSIQTLSNVENARVHLVMPADSVFVDQQQQGKASVILTLRSGSLTKEQAIAITRLVAGAVGQLKPEDVAIIDADSGRSLSGGQDAMDSGGGDSDLTARLISTLEPVAGPGKIRASVSVAYDQGTIDENEEKYDPDVSAVLSDQKTEDQVGGANVPSGVPGTTSNVPSVANTKPPVTPATQHSITENKQFAVNRTVVHTVTPAGRVQRISAAILVDDDLERNVANGAVHFTRHKRSPQEMEQIKNLAETVIGYDAKRGDTISVENISFNSDAADLDVPAPTLLQQTQRTVTDYSPALRPFLLLGVFLLAYFLIIRPVQKRVLSTTPAPAALPGRLMADEYEALPEATAEMHTQRAAQLKKQALETLRQNPLQTTRAVQAWLREENS